MRTMRMIIAAAVAILALCACGANPARRTARPVGWPTTSQLCPLYDAVLTWTNYDGWNDPDAAVYLLNGVPTGTGDAGLLAVMTRLRELPSGARLLIYPAAHFGVRKIPGLYAYLPPFWQHYKEMGDATRHLYLTIQDEDQFGDPVREVLPATRRSGY